MLTDMLLKFLHKKLRKLSGNVRQFFPPICLHVAGAFAVQLL